MSDRAIDLAIMYFQKQSKRKNGGMGLLARYVGVTPGQVTKWDKTGMVPAHHVPKLSQKTGIPKKKFRPDLWKD